MPNEIVHDEIEGTYRGGGDFEGKSHLWPRLVQEEVAEREKQYFELSWRGE